MAQDPQNSLAGANAGTATPQAMQAPQQLNPYKMQNGIQQMQAQGMPLAQSVAKAAENPSNKYADGGDVAQAVPAEAGKGQSGTENKIKNMPLKDIVKYLASHPDVMGGVGGERSETNQQDYKKGGQVSKVANMKSENRSPAGQMDLNVDAGTYAQGGSVSEPKPKEKPAFAPTTPLPQGQKPAQNDIDAAMEAMGAIGTSQRALTPLKNQPTGRYAQGGKVNQSVMPTYTPQKAPQPLQMDSGGSIESDNIVGYGPDGSPIIQNADGTESYGDVNSLLDRPKGASTLGTGEAPTNGVSSNAANSVAGLTNNMAKGGEESGVPPGSLSHEVADDVPAKLSEGEFVFSADVVRYYGLKTLNDMMEHARQDLRSMEAEGNIRSPGDGKNPNQGGTDAQFVQDAKPDLNTYDQSGGNKDDADPDQDGDNDMITGILKECQGGGMKKGGACYEQGGAVPQLGMADGGGVYEESFKKGGSVYGKETPAGTDNLVSSHPKGGSPLMDYAKGGIVSSKMDTLTPKKLNSEIPTGKMTQSTGLKLDPAHMAQPHVGTPKPSIHKFKAGGIIHNVNEREGMNPHQSVVG